MRSVVQARALLKTIFRAASQHKAEVGGWRLRLLRRRQRLLPLGAAYQSVSSLRPSLPHKVDARWFPVPPRRPWTPRRSWLT